MSKLVKSLNNQKVSYENLIYCNAYIIIVLKAFFSFTELIPHFSEKLVFNICNLIFLALLVYKMLFFQKYSVKQALVLLFFGLATLYTDSRLHLFLLVPAFFVISATQNIDIKKIISVIYKLEAVIISIHVLMYPVFLFVCPYAVGYTYRSGDKSEKRHQFLLAHANIFSMLLVWTMIAYIYVNYDKLTKKKMVGIWFIYLFFYKFANSNSGLIMLTTICLIFFAKKINEEKTEKIVGFLARYLYAILSVFFTIMMVIYPYLSGLPRDIWLSIDAFLTGRMKYGAYAYSKFGFSLMGQAISFGGKELWHGFWFDSIANDCIYMFLAVNYGIIYMVLIAFLFWKYAPKAKFEEKIVIIIYALYTMMELYVTYVYFCFAIILVMQYVWEDHRSFPYNINRS